MPSSYQVPLTVFTVLMNEKNEILLMRRSNTGFGDGNYALPGGHVEPHETIPDAARREVMEEVGVRVKHTEIRGVVHSNVDKEYLHFVAVAKHGDWSGKPRNMEPDQCDDMTWVPWGQWPANTLPCIRIALDNIPAGTFFGEYFPDRN